MSGKVGQQVDNIIKELVSLNAIPARTTKRAA